MKKKKLPLQANNVCCTPCINGHLHLVMVDENKNELCELILYDASEAEHFSIMFCAICEQVYGGNRANAKLN